MTEQRSEIYRTRLTPNLARGVNAFAASHHMSHSAALMQLVSFGLRHEQLLRRELAAEGSAAARRYLEGR